LKAKVRALSRCQRRIQTVYFRRDGQTIFIDGFTPIKRRRFRRALCAGNNCLVRAPAIRELPPLLQGASNDFIEALALLDAQMLVILKSGWRLPEALWESLAGSTLPQVPPREIAPFVPGGTGLNVVIRIGGVGERMPSSEASVSPKQQAK